MDQSNKDISTPVAGQFALPLRATFRLGRPSDLINAFVGKASIDVPLHQSACFLKVETRVPLSLADGAKAVPHSFNLGYPKFCRDETSRLRDIPARHLCVRPQYMEAVTCLHNSTFIAITAAARITGNRRAAWVSTGLTYKRTVITIPEKAAYRVGNQYDDWLDCQRRVHYNLGGRTCCC